MTLFRIKANGNPLYNAYVVYGGFPIEISQGNLFMSFIELYRRDWCRNLLNQSKISFPVLGDGTV